MHSNVKSLCIYKSNITINTKTLLTGITGAITWDFGNLYGIFHIFVYKMYLFAITAYFLSLPDKNHWFSSQRRREGVVGDANGSISK